jgi:hypothetical protein
MPFIKGQPKPLNSGRRQGVRNKKTISKTSDILLNEGLNPTQELIKLLPELNARDKIDVWKYLHSFTESKPKIKVSDPSRLVVKVSV